MVAPNDVRQTLGLPPLSQVGVVVRDVQRSADLLQTMLGLGPFTVYEFTPDRQWLRGIPGSITLRQGKVMMGAIELELMQPLAGESLVHEHLEQFGEGLHHLGFNVRDYDAMHAHMETQGFVPLMWAESFVPTYGGTVRACVFDTMAIAGFLVEVIWKSWLPECS